jgi:phenylpropionate dioxygenase-like ring-hydroxylating dioxygenase large terminal subunit
VSHLEPTVATGAAPAFAEARNRRQKVRAAGLDPNHWYAVEYDRAVKRGQVVRVTFWNRPIALYRGDDGRLRALEDRCAHRQLGLSLGDVTGCRLTCAYHGWSYGEDGRLAAVPHDLFGRGMPSVRIATYPVQVRYGLVWIFPGDPARAAERALPDLPELEGRDPWAYVPQSFMWRAHHSIIMDNLCDLTHAHLHRNFPAFQPGRLVACEAKPDRVLMEYEARVGPLVRRAGARASRLEIAYEYPYHRARFEWSSIRGQISYWTFLLPIDARTTRVFFMFCYDTLRVGFVPFPIGHRLFTLLLRATNPWLRSLLAQDGFAVEAEQDGYDRHFDAPLIELNPVVARLHDLTIRKWEDAIA